MLSAHPTDPTQPAVERQMYFLLRISQERREPISVQKRGVTKPVRTYRGAEPPEAQLQRPPPDRRLPAREVRAEAACRLCVLRLHGHPRGRGDRSSRRGQRRQRSAWYVVGWWLLLPRGEIISLDFEFATPRLMHNLILTVLQRGKKGSPLSAAGTEKRLRM